MEKELNGKTFRYIPKQTLANTSVYRNTIRDGDIIAIVTEKKGLDTSHIGIAVWHKNGLHMLHASLLQRKVVEDVKTLRAYMLGQKSQLGIRIVRIK